MTEIKIEDAEIIRDRLMLSLDGIVRDIGVSWRYPGTIYRKLIIDVRMEYGGLLQFSNMDNCEYLVTNMLEDDDIIYLLENILKMSGNYIAISSKSRCDRYQLVQNYDPDVIIAAYRHLIDGDINPSKAANSAAKHIYRLSTPYSTTLSSNKFKIENGCIVCSFLNLNYSRTILNALSWTNIVPVVLVMSELDMLDKFINRLEIANLNRL